jgi:hypothetical protein
LIFSGKVNLGEETPELVDTGVGAVVGLEEEDGGPVIGEVVSHGA